jgi:hypothetical protein
MYDKKATTAVVDKEVITAVKQYLGSKTDEPVAVVQKDKFNSFFWDCVVGGGLSGPLANRQYEIATMLDLTTERGVNFIIFKQAPNGNKRKV